MSDTTARLALPMIVPGQAQKEMTHNEALARLDAAVQASVEAVGAGTPPGDPALGQCWIVGATPTGAWSGHADALAMWTAGGWRFVIPTQGFRVWSVADVAEARFIEGIWNVGSPPMDSIADPTGGGTIDTQARLAIAAILDVLRRHNLVMAA